MLRRWGSIALIGVTVTSLVVASTGVASPLAFATPLQTAQAKAKAIANQINVLDNQVQVYAEDYDQAQTKLGQLQSAVIATRHAIKAEKAHLKVLQAEVITEADRLFMQGGTNSNFVTLVQTNPDATALTQEEINTATNIQQQDVVRYQAAQQALQQQEERLNTQNQHEASTVTLLATDRNRAQSAQAQAVTTLNQVNQQIQQLVYQQQQAAIQQREAQAAAALAAQQAQAQAAAALAAQQAPPAVGGSPSGASQPSQTDTPVPSSNVPAAAQAAQMALQIVNAADTTYVWGGAGQWENGVQIFDCSGLVMYIYSKLGIDFPHSAADQAADTTPILYSQLQPGDLVFYDTEGATSIDHVAIYAGNGQVVEATNPGRPVSLDPITWSGTPVQFGAIS
ncbi:C40 family peptidase [Ferrimicrobium sp.]|uniref:C40 family peptidase n=1 Tax=Ferrimicrobium sp. TaxID=2926050 RepID=UPI00261FD255|nr:C40 family peptidase [Ferrimicrobium sp.]